jgi:hypothetical protein
MWYDQWTVGFPTVSLQGLFSHIETLALKLKLGRKIGRAWGCLGIGFAEALRPSAGLWGRCSASYKGFGCRVVDKAGFRVPLTYRTDGRTQRDPGAVFLPLCGWSGCCTLTGRISRYPRIRRSPSAPPARIALTTSGRCFVNLRPGH